MKATYNRSQIMKNAYTIKRELGVSFGQAQKQAWLVARNEMREKEQNAKREAIQATWKAQHEEKVAKQVVEYNTNYIAGPARYYAANRYNGD